VTLQTDQARTGDSRVRSTSGGQRPDFNSSAPGCTVNAINPGGVETEGVHSMGLIGSEFEKQMVARTPLGRLGQPDDIASVAVFLASAESGWMTGETIAVGGGFS